MITTIHKAQKGFSLITAIFLVVVVASLGALMVPFVTTQQQSSAVDVLGASAHQAARAGIEWGAYQVLQNGPGCFSSGTTPALIGTVLSSSSVTVTVYCTVAAPVSPDYVYLYNISTSAVLNNGASPGSADYVERDMFAIIAASSVVAASSVNTGITYMSEI